MTRNKLPRVISVIRAATQELARRTIGVLGGLDWTRSEREYGVAKVIPDNALLAEHARHVIEQELLNRHLRYLTGTGGSHSTATRYAEAGCHGAPQEPNGALGCRSGKVRHRAAAGPDTSPTPSPARLKTLSCYPHRSDGQCA